MLENQDANVGRVFAKLDELKLRENTIIIYFSDNGPNTPRWTGGMKGKKGTTDEGGVRSVCYVQWPAQLPKGHTVTQIAGAIDLLPTLCSLTGVPRVGDKPLDGRDLTPLLKNQAVDWPERMLFTAWAGRVSVRTQRYRLDDQGRLFDMQADPGQTKPMGKDAADERARLESAVQAWRADVFADQDKANSPQRRNVVDARPIPVGYREFPITMLPARDGEPRGPSVKRSSNAPNSSYFVNWKSADDSLVWNIEVATAGRYEVTIDYTCPPRDAGATVELSFLDARLTDKVTPGWDPPLYTNQDTLPRPPAESTMKEFRPLKLGEITLAKGAGPLTLRALDLPGQSVMDLRRVTLTLLP